MNIKQSHSGVGDNNVNNPTEIAKDKEGLFSVKNIITWIVAPLVVAAVLYWFFGIK